MLLDPTRARGHLASSRARDPRLPGLVLTSLLALRVRARVALVPILSFPIPDPQLVACTQGAAAALTGDASAALGWAGILAAFALVYGVLGLTIVPAAIE